MTKKELKNLAKQIGKTIVVFDFETTGVDPSTTRPVQIGAIKLDKDGNYSEFKSLINPEQKIEQSALDVHHITEEMVKDAPKFKDLAKKIHGFFYDAEIVAGYNSNKFDNVIISRLMEECGFKNFLEGKQLYDAYPIYLSHHRRKLADCVSFYLNEDIKDAHDAIGDCTSTLRCIGKQIEKEGKAIGDIKLDSKGDIERYIVFKSGEPFLNFGKNKGLSFAKCDSNYLSWIVSSDFPKEIKDIINSYLKK